jgi:hypothetical protein
MRGGLAQRAMGSHVRAVQMHGEHLLPLGVRDVGDRRNELMSGVRHQNIERAEVFDGLRHSVVHLRLRRHVTLESQVSALRAQRRSSFLQVLQPKSNDG